MKTYLKKIVLYSKVRRSAGIFILALFVFAWILMSFDFSSNMLVNDLKISILRSDDKIRAQDSYIFTEQVHQTLDQLSVRKGMKMNQINFELIEEAIAQLLFVSDVSVYADMNGNMYIDIEEIRPAFRIITNRGEDFLVDINGKMLSLPPLGLEYLMVINGYTNQSFTQGKAVTDNRLLHAMAIGKKLKNKKKTEEHIGQLFIKKNGDVALYPKQKKYAVVFGDSTHIEEKIEKMYILATLLSGQGHKRAKEYNVKYKDQIVVTKH